MEERRSPKPKVASSTLVRDTYMLKKELNHPPEVRCVHCNRRKRHKSSPYCPACRAVLLIEGVIKPVKRTSLEDRWNQYLERFDNGMTQQQIADELGLKYGYISSLTKRARAAGLRMPNRVVARSKVTEHGGGTYGVRNCNCDLCMKTRREYKRQVSLRIAARRKEGDYGRSTTKHGQGSRGVVGCYCDLCKQARLDYRRAWTADVRANGLRKTRKNASVAQSGSSS